MIDPLQPIKRDAITFEDRDLVILCEGNDEAVVVRSLLGRTANWKCGKKEHGQTETDEIAAVVGQAQALNQSFVICLLFDAETNRTAAERNITGWIRKAGLTVPSAEGVFEDTLNDSQNAAAGRVFVGYLINPPAAPSGTLEDMFVTQVAGTAFGTCADAFAACATQNGSNQLRGKLLLRSYIACHNAYNTNLGGALQNHAFTLADPAFDKLRDFLKNAVSTQAKL